MPLNVVYNYIELAYSPISNYDFSVIKGDKYFQMLVNESSIYMITQRNEMTFENISYEFEHPDQVLLICEIRQKDSPAVLNCKIPIYQANLANDSSKEIRFHFEYALPKPNPVPHNFPQYNVRNLSFSYHDGTFVGWLSPENLIQNYLNKNIIGSIEGPINSFIKYHVHYVGKATEQNVWKRLTGHSTLQDILSQEFPFHYGTLPTHEIAILFFRFRENIGMHQIGLEDNITEETIDIFLGKKTTPSPKITSLDAEKAFIHSMQPKYNKEFYRSYPKSKDGLYQFNLDVYTFSIFSHIILVYENGEIVGMPNYLLADYILIQKDLPVTIIKNSQVNPLGL